MDECSIPKNWTRLSLAAALAGSLATSVVGQDAPQAARSAHEQNVAQQQQRETPSDPDVTAAVKREFKQDAAIPSEQIEFTTIDGIVTLDGTVNNLLAKERATRVAETVKGVRSVVNRMAVEPAQQMATEELKRAVEDSLMYDPATESYEVTVEATDRGKITLGGRVDSWAERELAASVAKGVLGVTEVANDIQVVYNADRSERQIRTELEQRYRRDTLIDDALLEVDVDGSVVTLIGTVGSAAEKRRAEELAWVAGVDQVVESRLRVARWARDQDLRLGKYVYIEDEKIVEALQDALRYDPRVSHEDLDPQCENGWVTLDGKVDTLRAKQAAESVARATVGVTGVTNDLTVSPNGDLDPATIAENIGNQLRSNPWLSRYNLRVVVDNNRARLIGAVDNSFEKLEAENVAYGSRHISAVNNEIEVRGGDANIVYDPYVWGNYPYPWTHYPYYGEGASSAPADPGSDTETADAIRNEFFWSPYVDAEDIEVSVEDGEATLTGTVNSSREKEAALENALEGGAVSVRNLLVIENA